jgi:ribosome-associated toxin RatA of RatAB toxin-antitoxin module
VTRAVGARTIECALDIPAPAAWLFDLTQDYTRRLDWDPYLSKAELNGERAGVGVRAWCVSRLPPWGMETVYVTFQRPHVVAIRMTKGPSVLRMFAGSWRFEARGVLTRVTFRYRFETRPALLAPVAERLFSWDMAKRLSGLRAYTLRHAPRSVASSEHPA